MSSFTLCFVSVGMHVKHDTKALVYIIVEEFEMDSYVVFLYKGGEIVGIYFNLVHCLSSAVESCIL